MICQYHAARSRGGPNPLRVGVIAVGSIYYLQDDGFFRDRHGGTAVCRTPWMVDAFLNGTLAAARRNPRTGRWEDRYLSGRSDIAVVRSLRDGRVTRREYLPGLQPFEGIGVVPDVPVPLTAATIREGRDPVLDRALQIAGPFSMPTIGK